jgi:uncharacterized protein (TIGR02145 family)
MKNLKLIFIALSLISGISISTHAQSSSSKASAITDGTQKLCDCPPTLKDVDGNIYKTVRIGNQCWMRENLRTTHYRDTTKINDMEDSTEWAKTSLDSAEWCYFGYNGAFNNIYGKLYNWKAVSSKHKIAPAGWHVPSDSEVMTLFTYLGGDKVAGGALKSTSTRWIAPNTGANNSSGFGAMAGGYRLDDGEFEDEGAVAFFWTSKALGTANAWVLTLRCTTDAAQLNYFGIAEGMYCRCVKDQ